MKSSNPLMIKDADGSYRPATIDEIFTAARDAADSYYRRDTGITEPVMATSLFMAHLAMAERETFACLFLDNKNRVIQYEELFYGTVAEATIYPREVIKRALYHNAAAAIVAHNHPSGIAEPSRADEIVSIRLKEALELVNVRLLDSFVIGGGRHVSLAEKGAL